MVGWLILGLFDNAFASTAERKRKPRASSVPLYKEVHCCENVNNIKYLSYLKTFNTKLEELNEVYILHSVHGL